MTSDQQVELLLGLERAARPGGHEEDEHEQAGARQRLRAQSGTARHTLPNASVI